MFQSQYLFSFPCCTVTTNTCTPIHPQLLLFSTRSSLVIWFIRKVPQNVVYLSHIRLLFHAFWSIYFLSYCTSSNCPKGRLSCASSFTFLIYKWQRLLSKPEMIIKDCGKWMAKNYFLKQTMILILWMNVSLFWKTCMCFKILSHGFHKPNEQGYN